MIRIFAAACAALFMIAACSETKDLTDVNAPFEKYLPWDAAGKDVKSGEGGLQYIVLKEGPKGGKSPVATDMVSVNYDGRTAAGEKFDSSFDKGRPIQFRLNQVIPGWTQGLQLMSEGDDYLFFIPNALAYGNSARGNVIKAGDDLVFRVQLESVLVPKAIDKAAWAKYTPWNSDLPEVMKTGSGLEYVVLASGDPAGPSPENGEMVAVHYEGRLAETGDMFDSSYERGNPETFPSNQLIPGWVEALAMMKPGDRWMIYIPSDLAYGPAGTPGGPIPPNAALVFEVELMDVMKRG
ncbi:FKBP-type peptidyl-prolyl cis-trans isomerase [Hyphomonas johnsonii]|uniref:Peptidyl-prolyl cis-trans isomerase n=1 Tax=Hyphomonas johnsonii MHS-2 TaxID=1280950 RepID=A0A059FHH1_9PROT|nr:FKBP-type peptidyl-prolyl cis-trans isomerase [Hyphomonas johnsonii]KCZ90085.1 FKBP-type peptidyl-prolyl cis-trans isomerase [Hyphomonas johnsonii MHS-2]